MAITDVEELARLASTSVAAYSTIASSDLLALDVASGRAGMADAQASAFAARSRFLSQQPNVAGNGFSAAVFEDRITGRRVLAIRGTEIEAAAPQSMVVERVHRPDHPRIDLASSL